MRAILSLLLLFGLLPPPVPAGDLRREVRDFYSLYYHIELDDRALSQLMDSPPR